MDYKAINAKSYIEECAVIEKENHIQYLLGMLIHLPKGYENLDAGIPWIPYWIT